MRTHRTLTVTAAAIAAGLLAGCEGGPAERPDAPEVSLVVLVTVDQLPTYLFETYDSLFSGGFRRLSVEGRYYSQMIQNYAETWTSSGHATLATGVYPSRHGIVENDWWIDVDGERVHVESVVDEESRVLGVPDARGRSPKNLAATGLSDWIAAADPAAELVSISAKPTSSMLMAGNRRGHVYYYHEGSGRFVTTSYYRDAYPEWVDRFNEEALPEYYADTVWTCELPAELRGLARVDAADFEYDGRNTTFPHSYHREVDDLEKRERFYAWWADTPSLDVATLALVREAVNALSLGGRGSVDYLAVGFSQTDRVGHNFGPYSLEQLDNLIRVDQVLDELIELLDAEVGRGRYVLALTSDHGTPAAPAHYLERGEPGKQMTGEERRAVRGAVRDIMSGDGSFDEKRAEAIRYLEQLDYVAVVMTEEELAGPESADSFVALYQRSYYPGRAPQTLGRYGLIIRYEPGTNWTSDATMHGSPYLYDRQIPLFLFGRGVEPGAVDEWVSNADVAPTLAELAGIPYPGDRDGRPLLSR
jgi:predicted AlkP superfamily pyrophosphatase or phosphodiesterase